MRAAIVYAGDEYVVPAIATAAAEAQKHLPGDAEIYIALINTEENVSNSLGRFLNSSCTRFHLVNVNSQEMFVEAMQTNPIWGPAAFARLYLDRILPSDIDRVLYLDSDTLIEKHLSDIIEINMRDLPLAAGDDFHPYYSGEQIYRNRALGLAEASPYFNSGVLLFDWPQVLQNRLLDRARQHIQDKSTLLKFPDQDALNLAFENRWLRLDPRWNLQDTYHRVSQTYEPWIIHFSGGNKPWRSRCPNYLSSYRIIYQNTLKNSRWNTFVKTSFFEKNIKWKVNRAYRAIRYSLIFEASKYMPTLSGAAAARRAWHWKHDTPRNADLALERLMQIAGRTAQPVEFDMAAGRTRLGS